MNARPPSLMQAPTPNVGMDNITQGHWTGLKSQIQQVQTDANASRRAYTACWCRILLHPLASEFDLGFLARFVRHVASVSRFSLGCCSLLGDDAHLGCLCSNLAVVHRWFLGSIAWRNPLFVLALSAEHRQSGPWNSKLPGNRQGTDHE